MKSNYFVEERIVIDADIHVVWRHLTDWDTYHQWNPFIINVAYKVDAQNNVDTMKFDLQWHDGKKGSSLEQMVRSPPRPMALLSWYTNMLLWQPD